jgi:hypothetical protein
MENTTITNITESQLFENSYEVDDTFDLAFETRANTIEAIENIILKYEKALELSLEKHEVLYKKCINEVVNLGQKENVDAKEIALFKEAIDQIKNKYDPESQVFKNIQKAREKAKKYEIALVTEFNKLAQDIKDKKLFKLLFDEKSIKLIGEKYVALLSNDEIAKLSGFSAYELEELKKSFLSQYDIAMKNPNQRFIAKIEGGDLYAKYSLDPNKTREQILLEQDYRIKESKRYLN